MTIKIPILLLQTIEGGFVPDYFVQSRFALSAPWSGKKSVLPRTYAEYFCRDVG